MKNFAHIFGFVGFCLFAVCASQAQTADGEALRVLRAALETLGGEARIKSFKSVYFSARGTENGTAVGQSYHPEKEAAAAHEEKLAVFMDGMRLAYEYKTDRGDGTTRWRRFFFTDSRRIVADFGTRSVFASAVKFPSADRDQDARRFPHALLLEALENSQTLKSLGTRVVEKRAHDVISVTLANSKIPIALYFDKQTGLLTKYEYSADFPALGASVIEYIFSGYRRHPKLGWFPAEHSIKINGQTFRALKFEQALVDSAEAETMLQLAPELEGFITLPGTVKEIAKGVYLVYNVGGYQPMFIEFKDFVLAVEAPASHPSVEETPLETIGNINALTEEFIAKIRQIIPNKPIKYVVLTHSHSDHMGGLRAFAPEKSTVLTTPGNKAFYERFVPDLKIETFDKKRVFTDGERTVELLNVGPNPHTEENIVVYLPQEQYLFQGDLFYFGSEATFPARDRMTVMPFFANWLKKNNLSPARIYGFHSVLFGTMEHIEKVLELNSKRPEKR
jgi:glyoxylase-like metal-dependent hydrolase (beta-lactamase superfamily II)